MKAQGIIYDKSKIFALGVIALCNELREKGEYVMSKQILKSGTSIGANYCEALGAESSQDFIHKIAISLKEINETYFWLDLLFSSKYIDENKFVVMKTQTEELYKMLNSTVLTIKQRQNSNNQAIKQSSNNTFNML